MYLTNNRLAYALLGVLAVLFLVAYVQWMGRHDAAIAESAQRYEQCVRAQYHTSPSAWYIEHGEYPTCEQ